MKKYILPLLLIFAFASQAQVNFFGGVASRVNDSATYVNSSAVTTGHTNGYADIWYSNASDLWWKWNGSAYELLGSGSGGGSWGSITGTLSDQTDLQNALNLKAALASPTFTGTPAAPTAATSTNTTQIATTAFVQQEIGANSLGFDPADELTEIAGITLEGDITVAQLLEALEIPMSWSVHADNAALITLTNSPNSETALGSSAAHYQRINSTNVRQMRLTAYNPTKSVSANNPRMYIQYSTNGGSAWTTLGAGTIASGDVISLFTGSANIGFTNWITLPLEARGNDITFRIVTHGGDGAADPVVGNIHIEGKT